MKEKTKDLLEIDHIITKLNDANAKDNFNIPETVVLKRTEVLRDCIRKMIGRSLDQGYKENMEKLLRKLDVSKTNLQGHMQLFSQTMIVFNEDFANLFDYCKDQFSIALCTIGLGQKGMFTTIRD